MLWRGLSHMDKGGLANQKCNENYDENLVSLPGRH
jgi:hypothetical protein